MARLIDVDKLGIGRCNPDVFENKSYADGWNAAVTMVENAPAVDAEPVRRGKWEWFEERNGNPFDGYDEAWGYRCSCCKSELPDTYDDPDVKPDLAYCPNCGAKMEDKSQNE